MELNEIRRFGGRAANQMRPVTIKREVMKNALGSCLVEFGDTRVLCAATIEDGLPPWRRASKLGWVTAEYAMLPAATSKRTKRETNARKGRSMEIERLIGRSLRTVCNMRALGEYTVTIDCDVLHGERDRRLGGDSRRLDDVGRGGQDPASAPDGPGCRCVHGRGGR